MALYSPALIKKLEEDLKKNPQSQSFCSLAYIYYKQGDIEKARDICLKGSAYHPSYAPAYILLAEIHYKEDKLDTALELLNKAKELNSKNPNVYKQLAQIYKKKNEPEKTLEAYRMLVFLSPNDSTALSSFHHLEKILNPSSSLSNKDNQQKENFSKQTQSEIYLKNKKTISPKEERKLEKLNQILARIDNYIKNMANA
ncbi:MAG: hypothetical protein OXC37_06100 [Bdellovibrionaceae bacterium]|nr:hypothetical protein [Pseudobdellovibrionaceae bacterium]